MTGDRLGALDVATANPDLGSICQIGIVEFSQRRVTESWQSLVDPEDEFDPTNVSIHGIDASTGVPGVETPTRRSCAETR